jgi:hypothetical protein
MKLFTVEEANALLPQLRRLWADIGQQRDVIRRLAPESKRASERARENGGSSAGIRYLAALQQIDERLQQIIALGIEIKDFERGLCDFPHLRDGRLVFLCWQQGEDRIQWWHELESGFAGRQPL